jgi:hypothetical protein
MGLPAAGPESELFGILSAEHFLKKNSRYRLIFKQLMVEEKIEFLDIFKKNGT